LVPKEQLQGSLFYEKENFKNAALMKTMDVLNKELGTDTVKVCRQGYSDKWKLRSQYLSKCYTTRLEHILQVKD
jgi:DNA polymerase V